MTQDEIIEMIKQVGFLEHKNQFYTIHEFGDCKLELETFAKLVAAKEREAIEKLFEELSDNTEPHKDYEDYDDGWVDACYACKLAVTSRGEA